MSLYATQIFGIEKPKVFTSVQMNKVTNESNESEDNLKGKCKKLRKRLRMSNGAFKEGRWTADEHAKFVKSCLIYGNNWKKVQKDVKTRSSAQIRSHAQKFVIRLCRKYNLRLNRVKAPLPTMVKRPKLPCKSRDQMEEEDRKILEMFNCFRKSPLFLESDDALTGESIELLGKEEEEVRKPAKKKLHQKKSKPLVSILSQNFQKKQIFKVEKIKKKENEIPLDLIQILLDLIEKERIKFEFNNLINYNDKILSLLNNYDIKLNENKQNFISWLDSNANFNFQVLSQCLPIQLTTFINEMESLMHKWDDYTNSSQPIFESNNNI